MTAHIQTEPAAVLYHLIEAVSTAGVLRSAAELGLLDAMSWGPRGPAELTTICSTDLSMTSLLLAALHGLGVARREADGRYELTFEGLSLVTTADRGWSLLAEVVRTGEPLAPAHTSAGAAALYPNVVSALAELFAPAARRAAELIAERCNGVDVLDAGAEAAPWSIALARHSPSIRVTALDLPAVLSATRRAVAAADLADRFDYRAADMFTCTLPEHAYDVVLLANVCHLFDDAQNRALLRRLRPVIRPHGLLAIIDVVAPPDGETPLSISLYALGLRIRTSQGGVRSLAAYQTWTSEAGFDLGQAEHLSSAPSLCLLPCSARSTNCSKA